MSALEEARRHLATAADVDLDGETRGRGIERAWQACDRAEDEVADPQGIGATRLAIVKVLNYEVLPRLFDMARDAHTETERLKWLHVCHTGAVEAQRWHAEEYALGRIPDASGARLATFDAFAKATIDRAIHELAVNVAPSA